MSGPDGTQARLEALEARLADEVASQRDEIDRLWRMIQALSGRQPVESAREKARRLWGV